MPTADEVRAIIARQRANLGGQAPPGYGRSGSTGPTSSRSSYNPSPYRSPAFLEAARNTDLAVKGRENEIARQIESVRAELTRALPRIEWAGQEALDDNNDGFESRGLFNSGARLEEGAEIRRDTLADYTDVRQRAAEQVNSLVAQAASARLSGAADLSNAALRTFGDLASRPSEAALSQVNSRTQALQSQLQQLLRRYQ